MQVAQMLNKMEKIGQKRKGEFDNQFKSGFPSSKEPKGKKQTKPNRIPKLAEEDSQLQNVQKSHHFGSEN